MQHEDPLIDTPFGDLPLGERVLYQDARLDLVVLEVRFTSMEDAISDHQADQFREALRTSGLKFDQVAKATQREFRLDIAPGNQAASTSEIQGWEFRNPDGTSVVLWPSAIAVQAGKDYERWSVSLRPFLEGALFAVHELLNPALVQRTGLRYINRLPQSVESEHAWDGRINSSLLGPVHHPVIGPRVRSAQQQLELELSEGRGATIRHGTEPGGDGRSDYLLDIDVFDTTATQFSSQATVIRAQRLNRTAMALFQQCVTEKLHEEMTPMRASHEATG